MDGSNTDPRDLLLTISVALSAIAVILAVVISWLLYRRASSHEDRIAAALVKPLLHIHTKDFNDNRAVFVANHGQGTAVITTLSVSKLGGDVAESLKDLMYQDPPLKWDYFSYFAGEQQYLRAHDSMTFAELSTTRVARNNAITPELAQAVIDNWDRELEGVRIYIEYQDVLGNPQPPCVRTFTGKSPHGQSHQIQLIRPMPKPKRRR